MARTINPARHEARRLQIIEAAARCFAKTGFDATTTADIYRSAGIGSGTLVHYFATKRAIFHAIFALDEAEQARRGAAALAADDPLGAVWGLIDLLAADARERELLGLVVQAIQQMGRDADFAAMLGTHKLGAMSRALGQTVEVTATTSLPSAAAWGAPTVSGPVRATVALPGSKSLTNRALILAALADGPSRISAPLRARDTLLMAQALRGLGTGIADAPGAHGVEDWVVTPAPLHGGTVDVGLAGTVMRFVPPVAALASGDVMIDGDAAARVRPMSTLIDSLRQAGAQVQDGGTGLLPFTIRGAGPGGVPGGVVRIDASASSQFVSALLLVGARYRDGLEIQHSGGSLPSLPHIEMTIAMLRDAGVEVQQPSPTIWRVPPTTIAARNIAIEPDLSNAGAFLAAAAVTGGRVVVPGWPESTTQPGDDLRILLARMGADVARTAEGLAVTGGALTGIEADLHDVGELTPVLVAIAALADGRSVFRGIAHLRGHETDRLAALAAEVNGLGGNVTELPDGLVIEPRPLHGGGWRAYEDHRMAQAGAILGLRVPGVEIDDIASTTKTLPDFPGMWAQMLRGE